MPARNISLTWAKYERISFNGIRDETGRFFIRELRNIPRNITTDVYMCSDARNQAVRQILSHVPYVNVLNTAGNVVYSPHERPSVVIAHGDTEFKGCGAVDYARSCGADAGPPEYPAIAKLAPDPIRNAEAQLEKIDPQWRAGVIYFDHARGEVSLIDGDHRRKTTCMALFDELKYCLANRYTEDELESMSRGQNPDVIFLNNLNTRFSAFKTFRINLQGDCYDGIIDDSLKYAMEHALRGEGSFRDTRVAVLAFRQGDPIPGEIQTILDEREYVRDFIKRGGEVYVMTVGDLPSSNAVYRINNG